MTVPAAPAAAPRAAWACEVASTLPARAAPTCEPAPWAAPYTNGSMSPSSSAKGVVTAPPPRPRSGLVHAQDQRQQPLGVGAGDERPGQPLGVLVLPALDVLL